tara:strand:+ start:110 stop:505 length:396 start_codon:yes stop_codon:yes gene_type:complete
MYSSEPYHPNNDSIYYEAIKLFEALLEEEKEAQQMLYYLHRLVRWLEPLGEVEMISWVRGFVIRELPGDAYGGLKNGHTATAQISAQLRANLKPHYAKIKNTTEAKFRKFLSTSGMPKNLAKSASEALSES